MSNEVSLTNYPVNIGYNFVQNSKHSSEFFWSLTVLGNNENGRNCFDADIFMHILKSAKTSITLKINILHNWTSGGTTRNYTSLI